jgi:putative acetyltransferase
VDVRLDDLSGPQIARLLQEHLRSMRLNSPPEGVHALDLAGLRKPEITFWTVWEGAELLGCGALKELDPLHGEIKSMRTAAAHSLYTRFGFLPCGPFADYAEDPFSVFMARDL